MLKINKTFQYRRPSLCVASTAFQTICARYSKNTLKFSIHFTSSVILSYHNNQTQVTGLHKYSEVTFHDH
jgi:hypothetical protein